MDAQQLFRAGKLQEAISALNVALEENPADLRNKTLLFELLCFAGEFEAAERQLSALERADSAQSMLGVLLYKSVINAEKARQQFFEERSYLAPPITDTVPGVSGKLNGREFLTLTDPDPRIGDKLEVFAAGNYFWIALRDIVAVRVRPPRLLRDLLWTPASVTTVPSLRSEHLQDVMIPAMAPLSWQHPDEEVRLGRVSEWSEDPYGELVPYGLKRLLVDDTEFPIVEIRELEIYPV